MDAKPALVRPCLANDIETYVALWTTRLSIKLSAAFNQLNENFYSDDLRVMIGITPTRGEKGECCSYRIALRNVTLYTCAVIKTFRHKGLQTFFETGSKAGIQPHHAPRLKRQLTRLDLAAIADDMNLPGWKLHPLSNGHWSVWVNGNWRLTFVFEGTDAVLVDYQDYH